MGKVTIDRVFIRQFYTLPTSLYAWISSVEANYIERLSFFLEKIEISGAHVSPYQACFAYELKKLLKNLGLIQKFSFTSGVIQA